MIPGATLGRYEICSKLGTDVTRTYARSSKSAKKTGALPTWWGGSGCRPDSGTTNMVDPGQTLPIDQGSRDWVGRIAPGVKERVRASWFSASDLWWKHSDSSISRGHQSAFGLAVHPGVKRRVPGPERQAK